jgi:hypothetical protein
MNYRKGSRARVQSKEWIDEQERGSCNIIPPEGSKVQFTKRMYDYAGREAEIVFIDEDGTFRLDIDAGEFWWEEWMMDPDYNPSASPECCMR